MGSKSSIVVSNACLAANTNCHSPHLSITIVVNLCLTLCVSPPLFSHVNYQVPPSLSLNVLFVFRSLHLSHLHLLPPTLSKTWSLCYLFSLRLGHCVIYSSISLTFTHNISFSHHKTPFLSLSLFVWLIRRFIGSLSLNCLSYYSLSYTSCSQSLSLFSY